MVIPFKDLQLKETVGKGMFGVVRKGYWTSSDGGRQLVAVKQVDGMNEKEVSCWFRGRIVFLSCHYI